MTTFWNGLWPCHVTQAKNLSFPYLKSYCPLDFRKSHHISWFCCIPNGSYKEENLKEGRICPPPPTCGTGLKSRKILTIPVPNDQLVIASDGSKSPIAVGATLCVKRSANLLVGGFFSAKLSKSQLLWFPCEIEALCIKLTLNYFAPYIKESRHTAKFLTDPQPCVQAFQKLERGEFSLSSRLSSFLVCLNSLNISLHHISGAEDILPDYVCRNPSHCPEKNCQVCKFIGETVDYAIILYQLKIFKMEKCKCHLQVCQLGKMHRKQTKS